MNAVVQASAVVATKKASAGDLAIAACQNRGATNKQLCKALWSTRGEIRAQVKGASHLGGLVLNKSDLTRALQALPEDDKCGFTLIPTAFGADLVSDKA